jgi:ribA/ribD-fused uncharacterized protein
MADASESTQLVSPIARSPRDLDRLRELAASGTEFEYVFFLDYGGSRLDRVDRACLSQWWPSPFSDRGRRFLTAEQYMMHRKADLFGDVASCESILGSRTPFQAQLLGRKVVGYSEEIWRERRFGIVAEGSELKFRQNPALGAYLASTSGRVLVEASSTDLVWGAGRPGRMRHGLGRERDPRRPPSRGEP